MSDVIYLSPGKREQTKLANRQAILEAARTVFGEMGFEAATVRDIIRRTNLSVGAFYNYYRSKEEVFDALADDGARRFRPILHEAPNTKTATDFESYIRAGVAGPFRVSSPTKTGKLAQPAASHRGRFRTRCNNTPEIPGRVRRGADSASPT